MKARLKKLPYRIPIRKPVPALPENARNPSKMILVPGWLATILRSTIPAFW
jgi:hypothetical protein